MISAGRIACATICIWALALPSFTDRKSIGIPGRQYRSTVGRVLLWMSCTELSTCFRFALLYIDHSSSDATYYIEQREAVSPLVQ